MGDLKKISVTLFLLVHFILFVFFTGAQAVVASNALPARTKCVFYNNSMCENPDDPKCQGIEECEHPEEGKRSHCFVVWTGNKDGVMNVSLKVLSNNFLNLNSRVSRKVVSYYSNKIIEFVK